MTQSSAGPLSSVGVTLFRKNRRKNTPISEGSAILPGERRTCFFSEKFRPYSHNALRNKACRALNFRRDYSSVFSRLPAQHVQLSASMKSFHSPHVGTKRLNSTTHQCSLHRKERIRRIQKYPVRRQATRQEAGSAIWPVEDGSLKGACNVF